MRFRVLLLVLSFFAASSVSAQPVIDSLGINEETHEVMLFGTFGVSGELIVLCDDVPLTVTNRSLTQISASIPDLGKGSCGWVSATIAGIESNRKLITYWNFFHYEYSDRHYPGDGYQMYLYTDTVYLRADLLSAQKENRSIRLRPVPISRFAEAADGRDGSQYDYTGSVFSWSGTLNSKFVIYPSTGIIDLDAETSIRFDDYGGLRSYGSDDSCGSPNGGSCYRGGELTPTLFPPLSLSVERNQRVLLTETKLARFVYTTLNIESDQARLSTVFDIQGRPYRDIQLQAGPNEINLSTLTRGLYFLRIQTNGRVVPFLKP